MSHHSLAAGRAADHAPDDCPGEETVVLTETIVRVEGGVVTREEIIERVTIQVTDENPGKGGFSIPGTADPDTGPVG
jgi:hypothetical protein